MALRGQEMFVPLTHPPGEAQADFGEALIVIAGIEHRAHYLAIDLPHPNGTAHPAGEVPSHHRTTLVKDLGTVQRIGRVTIGFSTHLYSGRRAFWSREWETNSARGVPPNGCAQFCAHAPSKSGIIGPT
jgi:hypothetical protein